MAKKDAQMRQVEEGLANGMKELADYVRNVPRTNRVVDARDGNNYLEEDKEYRLNGKIVKVINFGVLSTRSVCAVAYHPLGGSLRRRDFARTRQEGNTNVYVTPFEPIPGQEE